MKIAFLAIASCILLLLFSCHSPVKEMLIDQSKIGDGLGTRSFSLLFTPLPKPVFGYRFIVSGDFDGDGKQEKLTEHFFSRRDKNETNKFYENLADYYDFVLMTCEKRPYTFMLSDKPSIDTLRISDMKQQSGLSFLRNEGDLNGDGTDELSYVINNADWSSCNKWHIITYRNNHWKELYSFNIWDWQLPDVPETANLYGLFGTMDKAVNTTADSISRQQIEDLNNFKGLVKKLSGNKIRVICRNEEAEEDMMIVDLNNK